MNKQKYRIYIKIYVLNCVWLYLIYFYKAINFSVFYGWYLMIKERKNISQQHQINIKYVCVCAWCLIPYIHTTFFPPSSFYFCLYVTMYNLHIFLLSKNKKGTKKYNISLGRVKDCIKNIS